MADEHKFYCPRCKPFVSRVYIHKEECGEGVAVFEGVCGSNAGHIYQFPAGCTEIVDIEAWMEYTARSIEARKHGRKVPAPPRDFTATEIAEELTRSPKDNYGPWYEPVMKVMALENKIVGDRLRLAREKKGLQIYQAIKILGLWQHSLDTYEEGTNAPSTEEVLKKLMDFYGLERGQMWKYIGRGRKVRYKEEWEALQVQEQVA